MSRGEADGVAVRLTATGRVASPCVGRCRLDAGGLCLGCRRSAEEIGGWGSFDDAERCEVLGRIAARPAAAVQG